MPACVTCSQEIPATAAFCPRCGTPNPEARTLPTPPDGGTPGEPLTADELQRRLQAALGGDYVVGQVLGEGGFAVVFAAQERKLSRTIAVKVLRPELTASRSAVQRFVREAESAARLTHPNVLPIFFVGEGHGVVYFGMPLIDGETLDSLLTREGQLTEHEAARLGAEIADALAEAHAIGLVHRDVKPANVMLQGARRRAMVMDFGIAKAATAKDKLTGTGVVIGSPHYMSPEQASGSGAVDHRSDIYSLGVVLWQMLAGELPFDAPDSEGILVQHLTKPLPPIRSKRQDVSAPLAAALARCCAKHPEERFQTAAEVAEALRAAAPRHARRRRAWRPSKRTVAIAAAGAGLTGLLALAVVVGRATKRAAGPPAAAAVAPPDTTRSAAPMLAVLPFKVPAIPGATMDGPSIGQLLADRIGEGFRVATVDMNRLLGRWTAEGREVDALLDSNAAFAYSLGANQLAVGRTVVVGRQVRLAVDVYDTQSLGRLGHSEETGDQDSLFPIVDRLAASVARTFCRQPEFNPANLCYDTPARPLDALSVAFDAPAGWVPPPERPSYSVLVSPAGTLAEVRIRRAPELPAIREGAMSVLRNARYQPARKAGRPVEAWAIVEVSLQRLAAGGAEIAAGCDDAQTSVANPGRRCYDSRPLPRAAPSVPVPPMCAGAVTPVTILVRVSADGSVIGTPTVVRPSSCEAFTQIATAFAQDVGFAPARKGAAPVEAWTQVLVRPLQ
jgi:hypothetical protein